MSEETVLKFKLATLVTIGMGVLSLVVTILGIWVSGISTSTTQNSTDIATLKECTRNQAINIVEIKTIVEDIRNDQIRRRKGENVR